MGLDPSPCWIALLFSHFPEENVPAEHSQGCRGQASPGGCQYTRWGCLLLQAWINSTTLFSQASSLAAYHSALCSLSVCASGFMIQLPWYLPSTDSSVSHSSRIQYNIEKEKKKKSFMEITNHVAFPSYCKNCAVVHEAIKNAAPASLLLGKSNRH